MFASGKLRNIRRSVVKCLANRQRRRTIPKPKKPGQERTIEAGGVNVSVYSSIIVETEKAKIVDTFGTDQLSMTQSGADAAIVSQQAMAAGIAKNCPRKVIRFAIDSAAHYPSVVGAIEREVIINDCPVLYPAVEVTAGPTATHIVCHAERAVSVIVRFGRGKPQGAVFSAKAGNMLTARVNREVSQEMRLLYAAAGIDLFDSTTGTSQFALSCYADNHFGGVVVEFLQPLLELFKSIGQKYGLTYADLELYGHGSSESRDLLEAHVQSLQLPLFEGQPAASFFRRPDLDGRENELQVLMDVPIVNDAEENVALCRHLHAFAEGVKHDLEVGIQLRDLAITVAAPAIAGAAQSPSAQLHQVLKFTSSKALHLLKTLPGRCGGASAFDLSRPRAQVRGWQRWSPRIPLSWSCSMPPSALRTITWRWRSMLRCRNPAAIPDR